MYRLVMTDLFLNINLLNYQWNNHLTEFSGTSLMSKNGMQFLKNCIAIIERYLQSNIFILFQTLKTWNWPQSNVKHSCFDRHSIYTLAGENDTIWTQEWNIKCIILSQPTMSNFLVPLLNTFFIQFFFQNPKFEVPKNSKFFNKIEAPNFHWSGYYTHLCFF